MDLIALILLTLVGYSSGAVLGSRKRLISPVILDLVWIVLLWTMAVISRLWLHKWLAVAVWLIAAGVCSFVWASVRYPHLAVPKKSAEKSAEPVIGGGVFKRLWTRWTQFALKMGNFQGRILLAWFYFIVVTPFGLLVRLFSDPLHIKHRPSSSSWLERAHISADLESGRSQF